jgi:hypothetical protein
MSRSVNPQLVFAWMNSYIFPRLKKVRKMADLANCAALLVLMSKLYPFAVEESKIILNPEAEYEVIHNQRHLLVVVERLKHQLF